MYQHSWTYRPSHPDYGQAWPALLAGTRRIIDHVRQAGIVIAGRDGYRRPQLDGAVAFNGDATTDLDAMPLHLYPALPSIPADAVTVSAWCRTGRKPYDVAVAAVLLYAVLLCPRAFAVSSSGRWDQHRAAAPSTGRRPMPGARAVIAEVFGLAPSDSPLQP